MSNDNTTDTEKKSERSGLLTWISVLTPLIIAAGLPKLFQVLDPSLLFSQSPTASPQCLTDSQEPPITVNAKSRKGSCFQNTHSSTQTYEFFADGEWSHHPDLINDAGGHPELPEAPLYYRLPGYPEGALIARRKDDNYEFIGTEAELELKSGEKVFFTINDDKNEVSKFDRFRDNRSALKVDWNCKTCE